MNANINARPVYSVERTDRPIRGLRMAGLLMALFFLCSGLLAQRKPKDGPGAPPPGSGPLDYKGFVRVISGDTLEIYPNGTQVGVGIIGINSPQGNTSCGAAAVQLMKTLTKGGLYLAEDDTITFDSKGRRMYYAIARDNRDVALEMVKAGAANSSNQGKNKDSLNSADSGAGIVSRGCVHGGVVSLTSAASQEALVADDWAQERAKSYNLSSAVATAQVATAGISGGFSQQVFASGFTNPTNFAFLPDGRILVAEKAGLVKVIKNGTTLSTPFLDLTSRVNDYWDHGLIGMTIDPAFSTNGFVYFAYTYENNSVDYSGTKTARVSRFTAVGDTASLSSERIILGTSVGSSCQNFPAGADCLPSESPSHSAGQLRFDSAGNLFVTVGDGAQFNIVDDLALRAQDLTSLGGKVLRVTPTGAGLSTNPFWTGNASDNKSKVWALGIRNSFRFNLRSGQYPYLGDVGWDSWEEINAVPRGANLGWPCYEGAGQQAGYAPKAPCQTLYAQGASAVKPGVVNYSHFYAGQHVSTAALGGTFYTGTAYPAQYRGAFFYGDYGQSWLRYFTADANDNLTSGPFDFLFSGNGPVQIEQGSDGNLYYLSIVNGEIRKLVYSGADTVAPTVTAFSPSGSSVALNTTVSATFSELLDPSTTANMTLVRQSNGQPVPGSLVYDGNTQTITLTLSNSLLPSTVYAVTVKGGSTGVKDLAGNALTANQSWTFTTANPQPPPPGTSDLSSLTWTSAVSGWGPVELNMSNGEQGAGDGRTLSIRGNTYAKGLGMHAAADVHYFLGNACSTLTATIGIDNEVAPNGTVVFQVFGDGTKLYDSGTVTGASAAVPISVNVSGRNDLELVVTDAGDGNAYDHADWAIPRLTCGSPPPTTISNVLATPATPNSEVITWTTNNIADSQVEYGPTVAYGSSTAVDSSLVTSHSQQVTALTPNTTYHFRVKSRDGGGTLVTSGDSTFVTQTAGTTTTFLSDLTWTSMTNGWGPAEKDMSNGEQGAGDGRQLSIRGVKYTKGLGVHAASDIRYSVGGTCSTFLASVGTDDEVAPNGSVQFQVWADGTQLYDSGVVTGTMAALSVAVNIAGKQQLQLVVTDGGNGINSDHADWANARIVCGGTSPPVVTIASPGSSLKYAVGDVINYSGSARDAAGNAIPASSLSWQIIIHHCPGTCHTHYFLNSTGAGGTFTVPDHGDDSFFELILTAIDSTGLSSTASVSIQPLTVQLTLATSPSGLQVVYGGTPYTAPATITTVANSVHTIQTVSPQAGASFVSWSDGGAQQHNITIGRTNITITALFSALAVTSRSPAAGATGVPTNAVVTATFSNDMNPATITWQTLSLLPPGTSTPLAVVISYDSPSKTARMTPSALLQSNQTYTATVKGGTSGVKDTTGLTMPSDVVWTFTTAGTATGTTIYLSDLSPVSATNAWGPVELDMSNGEQAAGDGHPISIRGVKFTKGIGVHAVSDVRYTIPAGCTAFTATVGIDDEWAPNGSVNFQVLLDGTLVFDSGLMTGTTAGQNVSVNSLAGKSQLQLLVNDGGNGNAYDHADWADAKLSCSFTRPPTGASYLSDLNWLSMVNAWGPVEKDMSNGEQAASDGHPISIRGVKFTKGLGAHAVSDVRYNLGGACTAFTATVGVDDEWAPNGSVAFQVWADGTQLYTSSALNGTAPGAAVNVNVSGKKLLRLVITDGGDGNAYDHADWANAQITCP